ncbi:cation:proton antiporter [Legionella israelensis]|uniref:Cation:proton antiporter n=1 Tax=Legionella israelensis TaxID=454 RepID=A0A0W0WIE4_9GAMM|nr:NADH-quinone oxidoreductase subunit K [Legionella israelensis]KTD32124.1 Na(+)/H(+) antiporter subunit C [Legionella israelensis]QBR84878.1 cation:proton antiporter [Legionella israelensis]QBS10244.1 cation:proton antiporter [Legionella israelensis]SCY21020.1 multicomponent Na+:H+ antiporter subunit C [Legionella israelensis DSM 19235]STX59838.1 Multiple resistance and pH homeostasis protein C [Legionella israelensis]
MSLLIIMTGLLTSLASYLLMSRQLGRWLYGLILFSSIINITILLSGRVYLSQPAFIDDKTTSQSINPLPQAMVLTSIVIAFAVIIFSLILLHLFYKNHHRFQFNTSRKRGESKNKRGMHE